MRDVSPHDQTLADRYVDNDLPREEAQRFEARLPDEPALAAFVNRLRAVDDRLRGAFAVEPMSAAQVLEMLGSGSAGGDERGEDHDDRAGEGPYPIRGGERSGAVVWARSRGVRWAVAAAVVLVAAIGVRTGLNRYAAWVNRFDGAALYADTAARFVPQHVCSTPEQFAAYTDEVFGVALTANFGAGVQLVGWKSLTGGYGNDGVGEAGPRLLLARALDGTEIVVLFEQGGAWAPEMEDPALHAYERRLAGLRLTEISRLDRPVVLELIEREKSR